MRVRQGVGRKHLHRRDMGRRHHHGKCEEQQPRARAVRQGSAQGVRDEPLDQRRGRLAPEHDHQARLGARDSASSATSRHRADGREVRADGTRGQETPYSDEAGPQARQGRGRQDRPRERVPVPKHGRGTPLPEPDCEARRGAERERSVAVHVVPRQGALRRCGADREVPVRHQGVRHYLHAQRQVGATPGQGRQDAAYPDVRALEEERCGDRGPDGRQSAHGDVRRRRPSRRRRDKKKARVATASS